MKKIILLCIITIAISNIGALLFNKANATILGPVEVGSLVDENFSFLFNSDDGTGQLISGWNIDKKGGSISGSYNQWFKVIDTSNVYPVTLNKQFATQNSGKISFETRFKPKALIDGISFQLRNGTTTAIDIFTQSGKICYKNSNGQTIDLRAYQALVEIGLKVNVDISNHTMDIYLDGIQYLQSASFNQSISILDNIFVSSGAISTGEFDLSTIRIYKGYNVWERFISSIPSTFPTSQWQTSGSGGTANIQKMACATEPDTYSLVLNDTSTTNNIAINKQFDSITGNVVLEYKFYMPTMMNTTLAKISSNSNTAIEMSTLNGIIYCVNSSGNLVQVVDFKQNIWYHIKVIINTGATSADVYVNGKKKLTNITLNNNVASVNKISFSSSISETGAVWLDDILVYNKVVEPADYVPQPQPVFSPSTVIGIQNCSLWREGSHNGWDRINGYPERKPYLGFYDEGSPEVADWEIKWLVEHGINYQLYCWFRPATGVNNPVKDPYLNYALHDGYFNAKYSDQMKFAIMWENGASRAQDSADFRNNIVPYWVEYYLKDPRYMVVNNKPVISLYSMTGLKRDFGTSAQIKAETDYLRTVCKGLGFDDAIIMTANSGASTTEISEIKASGIDCVYSYSWGSLSANIDAQKIKMQQQRDANIDVVPTISMGRNDEAWRGLIGKYTSPNDFANLTGWVKDTFAPSLSTTSVGSKMVMLDNWNEFGEGHFLMPSGLQGFNYLDAIRSVYTSGTTHTDAIPIVTQKNRINTLYPQDRIVTVPPTPVASPMELYKSKLWNFNSTTEGWVVSSSVSNLAVSGGYLNGTSTSDDPSIQTADNLNIDTAQSSYIVIKMKNSTSSVSAQIFFQIVGDTVYTEAKSVQFIVNASDSDYTEYIIDMKSNSKWTGVLKRIRIDPCSGIGNFSIDYIGITKSILIKAGDNLISNGGFENSTIPTGYATIRTLNKKDYRNGYQSLSVTKDTSTYGSAFFPINSIANRQSFYYSIWAKLPPGVVAGVNNGSKFTFCIQYKLNGVTVQKGIKSSATLSNSKWVQLNGVYTIDEQGVVTNPSVYMYSDGPPVIDTIYFDDVEVRPLSVEFTSTPVSQASDTQINTKVDMTFDVDMDNTKFIPSNIMLNGSSTPVKSISNSVSFYRNFLIDFNANLENNKDYILSIKNLATLDAQSLPYVSIPFKTILAYTLSNQKFYKDYGKAGQIETEQILNGDITAVSNFSNNTADPVDVSMVVALYENGVLKTTNNIINTINGFSTLQIYSELNVPNNGYNHSVKQFFWNSLQNLKPYSNAKELK